MKKLVLVTSQNLASSNCIKPALYKLKDQIECVVIINNIPLQSFSELKRFTKLCWASSFKFLIFKLIEIDFHWLLVFLKRKRIVDELNRLDIAYFEFSSMNSNECRQLFKKLKADYIVNTSPAIYPKEIIESSTKATLNCHGAKLPEYRGPANYVWNILNNETKATATLHRLVSKIDAGPIWFEESFKINPQWSIYRLNYETTKFAGEFLAKKLETILEKSGPINEKIQDESKAVKRSFPKENDMNQLRKKKVVLLKWREVCTLL